MNVDTVLNELKGNVEEYDLKEIAIRAIRKKFHAQHDIYINESKHIDKYHIDTIEGEITRLSEMFISQFGNMKTARTFYHLVDKRFCFNESDQDKKDVLELHKGYQISNTDILFIVRYGITGDFDKDYSIINGLLETPDKIGYGRVGYELKVNDIVKIKSFKNGKILVTGMTPEQRQIIIDGFKMVDKFKNHPDVRI